MVLETSAPMLPDIFEGPELITAPFAVKTAN
jgi:hypothetical protein